MKSKGIVIMAVILFLSLIKNTNATLIGDTVDAGIFRDSDACILGYGLDGPFVAAAGSADQLQYSSAFLLDVGANGFMIDYVGGCPVTSSCG